MKRIGLLFIALLMVPGAVKAQKTDFPDEDQVARIDSLLSDVLFRGDDLYVLFNPQQNFHFIYAGTNFNTKLFCRSRDWQQPV
jgi:hypothetical protein